MNDVNDNTTQIKEWESKTFLNIVVIEKDEDVHGLIAESKAIGRDIKKIKEWFGKHKARIRVVLDGWLEDEKKIVNPRQERRDLIQSEVSKYELKKETEMKALEIARLKDADREEIDKRNELRKNVKRFEESGDLAQANLAREQIKIVIAEPVIIEDDNKVIETVSGNLTKKHDYDVFVEDKKTAIQTILDGKGSLKAITINEKEMKRFMQSNEFDPDKDTPPAGFGIVKKIKY